MSGIKVYPIKYQPDESYNTLDPDIVFEEGEPLEPEVSIDMEQFMALLCENIKSGMIET